jgi:hypothetical protein
MHTAAISCTKKLRISLNGQSVKVELQAVLDTAKDAKPREAHDNGSKFVNRNLVAVIKTNNLIDIKIKPRHPESNLNVRPSLNQLLTVTPSARLVIIAPPF